jgi:phosphoglucosamine mutase
VALFGTDGIRGLANGSILTAETALSAAVAAAHILVESSNNTRPIAIVGQDSRASGEFLEAAVVAGLASADGMAAGIGYQRLMSRWRLVQAFEQAS